LSSDHLVVVEKLSDFRWTGQAAPADTDVVTAEAFIAEMQQAPSGAARRPRKIINLCREYGYLSLGYYCSLLAEARGDRVTPSVETILDLLQRHARQALLPQLDRLVGGLDAVPRSVDSLALHVYFGHVDDAALSQLARKAFELFRCPLLEIQLERAAGSAQWHVASVESLDPRDVDTSRDTLFISALTEFTRRRWHPARPVTAPKMDLAILHDPDDPLPPSSTRTLRHMADIGRAMGIEVELIRRHDYSRLTQFDALLIRETTAVPHHTFKFARKAASAGMPVIDDPGSIMRCTNKAYLAELLQGHGVATPRTRLVSRRTMARLERDMRYPVVLKVPDGSFSRDVKKADDFAQFQALALSMLKESEIVLVQDFMYTPFDWRVGVLDGQPLFVARYHMVRDHWQIMQHAAVGGATEGRTEAVAVQRTPHRVLETAIRAAALIGDGFYGVDLKETPEGVFVIEVNDNPNLDVGAEDQVLGDELYRRLLGHLHSLFEARGASGAAGRPDAKALPTALPILAAQQA